MYLQKNLQGYFETIISTIQLELFHCQSLREPGASEQLQPAQDRGFTAPVMPRCVLLFLPSIGPGSHCMVCELNRLNWLKTSSFLSLLHQCLANSAPRFSSLHTEMSTTGKALPEEQQISLYETINFSPIFKFK